MAKISELALYIYGFGIGEPFCSLLDFEEKIARGAIDLSLVSVAALVSLLKTPGVVCFETGDCDLTLVGFPVELVTPNDSLGTWTAGREYNQVRRQLIDQAFSVIDGESQELINESLNVHWALSDGDESICSFNYDSLCLNRSEFGKPLWASSVDVWLDGPNKGFLPTTAEEHRRFREEPDSKENKENLFKAKILYQL